MEIKLDKRYPVDASPAQVWAVLQDVRAVAACMPGATITEQTDATHYKGAVKVKLGPALAAFAGSIEVLAVDADAQRTRLLGKGADKSGSTATMNLDAQVEPGDSPGQSVLVGQAVVSVNGKLAQFGGRLMVQVSDMILGQFADNFRIAAAAVPVAGERRPDQGVTAEQAEQAGQAGQAEQADTAANPAQAVPPPAAPAPAEAAAAAPAGVPPPAPARPAADASAPPPPAPQATTELNALAIAWQLVKNWFGSLFRKRG